MNRLQFGKLHARHFGFRNFFVKACCAMQSGKTSRAGNWNPVAVEQHRLGRAVDFEQNKNAPPKTTKATNSCCSWLLKSDSSRKLFRCRHRASAIFFTIPFASQRRFQSGFFSRRDVKSMSFDFTNDVFLLHFAFEPAECAFQRLVITEFNFCQRSSPAFQSWQFLEWNQSPESI